MTQFLYTEQKPRIAARLLLAFAAKPQFAEREAQYMPSMPPP